MLQTFGSGINIQQILNAGQMYIMKLAYLQGQEEPNYFQVATEMKIVREMLKALEGAIAAVDCSGSQGFTRGGIFMYELLSKMKVASQEDLWRLINKLDQATTLIADDATEKGRRCNYTSTKCRVATYVWAVVSNRPLVGQLLLAFCNKGLLIRECEPCTLTTRILLSWV